MTIDRQVTALQGRIEELVVRAETAEDLVHTLQWVIAKMGTTEALLFTFPKAGEILNLGRTRVFQLVKAGKLKAVQVPEGGRMIRRCDLEEFVAGCAPARDSSNPGVR